MTTPAPHPLSRRVVSTDPNRSARLRKIGENIEPGPLGDSANTGVMRDYDSLVFKSMFPEPKSGNGSSGVCRG